MTANFSLRHTNNTLIALTKPTIMGVVNCSPNSFYNPIADLDKALQAIEDMVQAGAGIIDIGGEATSPNVDINKEAPSVAEEIKRVVPLIAAARSRFDVLLSVDTSTPQVIREAVAAGVDIINDQRALSNDDALAAAAELNVPVCLMHFFKTLRVPDTTTKPALLSQITTELSASVQRALAAGISRDRIIIDPGFGGGNYGKSAQENYYLLAHLHNFAQLGFPILAGVSRKLMIGAALGDAPAPERLYGSIAAAVIAMLQGAAIIRVHDVKATVDAMRVVNCYQEQQ